MECNGNTRFHGLGFSRKVKVTPGGAKDRCARMEKCNSEDQRLTARCILPKPAVKMEIPVEVIAA